MPKESPAPKHFRKGTKSCVECRSSSLRSMKSHHCQSTCLTIRAGRQRKLKCDGHTPCQNCRSHGRTCVLQTEMARTGGEAFKATSRDRIAQLEDEVGSLWAVVRELRSEMGLKGGDEGQVSVMNGPPLRSRAPGVMKSEARRRSDGVRPLVEENARVVNQGYESGRCQHSTEPLG